MKPRRTQAFLFDFDGTLIDSLRVTIDAFKQGVDSVGYGPATDEQVRKHFGAGELQIFRKIVGPDLADAAYSAYREYALGRAAHMPLHRGVREVLFDLREQGLTLGIVTGRGRDSTQALLAHHDLRALFDIVVTDDDVSSPKPDPAGLRLALSQLNQEPSQALYIGDTWADIRAAHQAGIRAIGARWDLLADFRPLGAEEQPERWLNHPREILCLT